MESERKKDKTLQPEERDTFNPVRGS